MVAPVVLHVGVHVLGGAPQRQLPKRRQVSLAEELLHRARGLLGQVHLALGQPPQQVLRRQVHELDLVGLVQQVVGKRLAHHDAGDALDQVVDTLQVDVERRPDVDARVAQLARVLPALAMHEPGALRVGELVEQLDVELGDPDVAMLSTVAALEALGERGGLGARGSRRSR